MDCSPVVLSSLNTGAKYSSPPGLGERQRLEHRLRLVFGLPELARRVRVGYDARAGLHDDPVRAHERAPDGDGGVQVRGAPTHVSDRPGVGPTPLRLELVDDRSEERRVGKECRSRWSADGEKKKVTRG